MIDLGIPTERQKWLTKLEADIDSVSIKLHEDGPRKHLGASIVGDKCQAKIWNSFRWLKQEKFSGRQLRLFKRGHREEPHLIELLLGAGFDVSEINPATGKQWQISGSKGHYGGSCDGIARRADVGTLLLEFKTSNDSNFVKLKKDRLKKAKPVHYSQMCQYGYHLGLNYGLYMVVNKETDEIHVELVELDHKHGADMALKADIIIQSQRQPAKISLTPTFFDCRYCHFSGICHSGELPEKNCRSCEHAAPGPDKSWCCDLAPIGHNVIPEGFIPHGCDNWKPIING